MVMRVFSSLQSDGGFTEWFGHMDLNNGSVCHLLCIEFILTSSRSDNRYCSCRLILGINTTSSISMLVLRPCSLRSINIYFQIPRMIQNPLKTRGPHIFRSNRSSDTCPITKCTESGCISNHPRISLCNLTS